MLRHSKNKKLCNLIGKQHDTQKRGGWSIRETPSLCYNSLITTHLQIVSLITIYGSPSMYDLSRTSTTPVRNGYSFRLGRVIFTHYSPTLKKFLESSKITPKNNFYSLICVRSYKWRRNLRWLYYHFPTFFRICIFLFLKSSPLLSLF